MHYTWTTCSKVIQSEVNTLQTELQRLLGKNLLGIYLHGSLALGGFQPGRSDIDVIVVTAQSVDLETKRRCIELLLQISKMPSPLDIRFLVEQDLFPFQQPLPGDLHYNEIWRENYQQELRSGTWKDWNGSCIGYLDHPFKNRHFEKRLIKEKRERMSSWQESVSWTRDAVLERESPPDLACRVLECGRASAKGGTERVGSAIEG